MVYSESCDRTLPFHCFEQLQRLLEGFSTLKEEMLTDEIKLFVC